MRSSLLITDCDLFDDTLSRGASALVNPNSLWLSLVNLKGSAIVLGFTNSLLRTRPRTFWETYFLLNKWDFSADLFLAWIKRSFPIKFFSNFSSALSSRFLWLATLRAVRAELDRTDVWEVEVREGLCESEFTDLLLPSSESLCLDCANTFWAKVTPDDALD